VGSVQQNESVLTKNENKPEGVMTQLENFLETNESKELNEKRMPDKQKKRQSDKQNTATKNKRSAAQTKAHAKKAKAEESVERQTVCDTNKSVDMTPDLVLTDNQQSGAKQIEEKVPQKVPNRRMSRSKTEKKLLPDISSSEDISEDNSFEKAVLNKKLASKQSKRKSNVTTEDKVDSSKDQTLTKSRTNQRKRPSTAVEEENDDKIEVKSSANSKRKPLSVRKFKLQNLSQMFKLIKYS